jgi:hypothetical protein
MTVFSDEFLNCDVIFRSNKVLKQIYMNSTSANSKSRYARDFILSGNYDDDSDEAFGRRKGPGRKKGGKRNDSVYYKATTKNSSTFSKELKSKIQASIKDIEGKRF